MTVYCHRKPDAHWLAGVYRDRAGALRIQFDARRLLDPRTFQPRAEGLAQSGGDHLADMQLWEGQSGDPLWFRCRCTTEWPLSVDRPELLEAAAEGKPRRITAAPTAVLRGEEVSKP